MKFIILIVAGICIFATTACDTVTSADGTKTTSVNWAEVNQITQVALDIAKEQGGGKNAAAIQAVQNDLNGVAAQAQANVGKTPTAANVAQGAANPAVGAAVQSSLPNTPITQQTVNTIFAAAGVTPVVSK